MRSTCDRLSGVVVRSGSIVVTFAPRGATPRRAASNARDRLFELTTLSPGWSCGKGNFPPGDRHVRYLPFGKLTLTHFGRWPTILTDRYTNQQNAGVGRVMADVEPASAAARGELNASARDLARVAARLFATHGYEATSVRMIVEAAGVTKPTLYYYFGSKEGLAQALLTLPMAALADSMRAILEEGGDPIAALVRIVEAHFRFCREDADCARFFFALAFGPQGSEILREVKKSVSVLPRLMIEAIGRLAEAGVIAPE